MDYPKLPELIREVLVELKNTDFIITGSYALLLHGLLDRPPSDLDIISDSPVVLNRLRKCSLDMAPVFETITQERFIYQSQSKELYVDVFPKTKDYEYTDIIWEGLKLKVLKPKEIYLNKLEEFYDLPKTKDDLISYFKNNNNQ